MDRIISWSCYFVFRLKYGKVINKLRSFNLDAFILPIGDDFIAINDLKNVVHIFVCVFKGYCI